MFRGKHQRTLFNINCNKIFFNPSPTVRDIKTKINNGTQFNSKDFYTANEIIKKIKAQLTE